MTAAALSDRALNRATLARQLLLERASLSPLEALEHLVGLQAQVPLNPYTGLWSRLEGFRPEELARLLVERRAVRTVLMRATLHLVAADDCLRLRPLVQPVLDAELARHPQHGPALDGAPLDDVLAAARAVLAERSRTPAELRTELGARFPGRDGAALAYAARNRLALVQVPPRGVWGKAGGVVTTTAEAWLGRPPAAAQPLEDVLLRYLAAFGPASVADMSAWSGLTGLREVADRVRTRLRAFRDERGRELLDLHDAPRPDPDTPAPPRFLPEYDNVLLSHADRSRFRSPLREVPPTPAGELGWGALLHDGVVAGRWRLERGRGSGRATLVARPAARLPKRAAAAVAAEGRRLLRFLAADADERDVRLVASDGG